MKKFLLSLVLVALLIPVALGAKIKSTILKSTDGTAWTNISMATATGTYYSRAVYAKKSLGFSALLVKTSAGSLVITFEVSDDGATWYTPKDTNGMALNSIATALTVDTWIVFSPQLAEFIRFKFVITSADSVVSATYKECTTN